jgi:hypothetical protein
MPRCVPLLTNFLASGVRHPYSPLAEPPADRKGSIKWADDLSANEAHATEVCYWAHAVQLVANRFQVLVHQHEHHTTQVQLSDAGQVDQCGDDDPGSPAGWPADQAVRSVCGGDSCGQVLSEGGAQCGCTVAAAQRRDTPPA